MNSISKLLIAVPLCCLIAACTDDRNNFMVDDSISYVNQDKVVDISVFSEKYDLSVVKSGKGESSATVGIAFPDTALTSFNTANGTDFVPLSTDLFSISSSKLSFDKREVRKIAEITWKADAVVPVLKSGDYAIPCSLSASGVEVNDDRNLVMICPKLSKVSMADTLAGTLNPTAVETQIDTLTGEINVDYPIDNKDIQLSLAIDNTLVDSYNTSHGTSYTQAPDGLITVLDKSVTISEGESSVTFRYALSSSKFYSDGAMLPFTAYLVPISIVSTSISGLPIAVSTMYVPIKNESKTLMGPWTVLEGVDLCYAKEDGAPAWGAAFTVDRLVDGNPATEWISPFRHDITFPMTFVFDLGGMHLFQDFWIKDFSTNQGNYRQYEMYIAKEYNGADTQWSLIASGERDYTWTNGGGLYEFPVQNLVIGRYLKFVIVKPEYSTASGDYQYGRGKLSELYGTGL